MGILVLITFAAAAALLVPRLARMESAAGIAQAERRHWS